MAKPIVRMSVQMSLETAEKLEELAKEYGTKTAVIEAAINRLYDEKHGDK